MKFSIVTPSFNQLEYLKRCIASVADQKDADVEHIVIDGGSTDGTVSWLQKALLKQPARANYRLAFVSEADEGMYDALNKGLNQSSGDFFAWLNCDEQYLPDTLGKVVRFFEMHQTADFIYGDTLLVDPFGKLLTYRKNPPLRRVYVLADHLYTQSASMFFRHKIFASGIRFNPAWKAAGDCDFVVRILEAGFRPAQVRDYLSAYTMTGRNMSQWPVGVEELRKIRKQVPLFFQWSRPALNGFRYFEKFLMGGYGQKTPFIYDLYVNNCEVRTKIFSRTASSRFKWNPHD